MSEDSIALVKFSLSYKPNHPTIHLESSENISVPLRLPPPLHLFYHIGYLIVSANLKFFIVMNICNIQISFMNSLIYRELRLFHYMRFITGSRFLFGSPASVCYLPIEKYIYVLWHLLYSCNSSYVRMLSSPYTLGYQ